MYYDIVYTRCRHGIDILHGGQPILTDGFKVYSCSSELYKKNLVDLSYLMNILQKKQSFAEPAFMDDAYLFYVPDKGEKFLTSFHPVPYDLSVTGDFSKRPGMYLNHALIGSFVDLYPYQLFHDNSIWTAEQKNEAYYYENEPSEMTPRDITKEEDDRVAFDTIKAFVHDGRKDALKKAVSFLVKQYDCSPAQRKYLIIKDTTQQLIEMWIAAIESAFSPRIAAGVSFATRMDKYANSNVYFVEPDGLFSSPQQRSSTNQQRIRTMIVGVVISDKANDVRMIEGAPYVVLDGTKKAAQFDVSASLQYFDLITRFDKEHFDFTRNFLTTFSINQPIKELDTLYSAYRVLTGNDWKDTKKCSSALCSISGYKLFRTDTLVRLYANIASKLDDYLTDNLECSLPIINWFGQTAKELGDDAGEKRIASVIRKKAEEVFFTNYREDGIAGFWGCLSDSPLRSKIAKVITDERLLDSYSSSIRTYTALDAVLFHQLYFKASNTTIEKDDFAEIITSNCLSACIERKDVKRMNEIIDLLQKQLGDDTYTFVLKSVQTYEPDYMNNIICFIANSNEAILCDVKSYGPLFAAIRKAGLNRSSSDYLYSVLDDAIKSLDQKYIALALEIQDRKQDELDCINSAHLAALDSLKHLSRTNVLEKTLEYYVIQGFPSAKNDQYIKQLVSAALKCRMRKDDLIYWLDLLSKAPSCYLRAYLNGMCFHYHENRDKICTIVDYASNDVEPKIKKRIQTDLTEALIGAEIKRKELEAIANEISDRSSKKMFDVVTADVQDAIKANQGSVAKRIFGMFKK